MIIHLFRKLGKHDSVAIVTESEVKIHQTEFCFNIELEGELSKEHSEILHWLLAETFEPEGFGKSSFFQESLIKELEKNVNETTKVVEVGPRLNFSTAWASNAITICHLCGLKQIKRIERSTRYLITYPKGKEELFEKFSNEIHDRMTECFYLEPLKSFESGMKSKPVQIIPVLEKGKEALETINKELGLAFDEHDLQMYLKLFLDLNRNPTDVELFDLSQSNSEHSRHWFFRGRLVIDGKEIPETLMDIVKKTLTFPNNSEVAFSDNSSGIRGFSVPILLPSKPGKPSPLILENKLYHILFTAETHNFPTGVAPRPGAETGIGGRIRDVHAIGKGGLVIAGTAGYCVGNLYIPDYELPWEDPTFRYPENIASPLKIEIEASNGASDYGNKFGEPIIQGYTRSFGMKLPNGERREWIKPIMFTGGIGQFDDIHKEKGKPEKGMLVVKIGGPAYRIGFGGGSASSLVQGTNEVKLDFNAVQRGDAEMEQKLNRVIKACVEMGQDNPIVSIHDQGAGGSGNVLKEIVDPQGAKIDIRKFNIGDESLSVMEIWGAEYQENDAILIHSHHQQLFQSLCDREHVPVSFVGHVTGDGKIILYDSKDNSVAVDLELEKVLGKMPPKVFHSTRIPPLLQPLQFPPNFTLMDGLNRVLRLLSVGSKLFLTNKVDRSVSGLIVQQQCVGPLQLPLSNVSVIAQSYYSKTGAATSIGEQPIKGLLNYAAMARLSVGEAVTNLVWAKISNLKDVKCSGNWMWAAKLEGEGAAMYDTAIAMKDIMLQLGIAIDGGKDSLSMAAHLPNQHNHRSNEIVKGPGSLVISTYVTVPDITKVVTPDLKFPGESEIYFIDIGEGRNRLGGSSLAQTLNQLGNECPDVNNVSLLKQSFECLQVLIGEDLLASGHDVSDGGLIVTLLEMAFAGNCGLEINLEENWVSNSESLVSFFFNEELGFVFEVKNSHKEKVNQILSEWKIPFRILGSTLTSKSIRISHKLASEKKTIFEEQMTHLRDIWNETSSKLELKQTNKECSEEETRNLQHRTGLKYEISFTPQPTLDSILLSSEKPNIAILREEGSNGDREMAAAFYSAGFHPWDITTSDLIDGRISLNDFRGLAFVGGFSFGDVLDSAKGWASVLRFHSQVWSQFQHFYQRTNTFSLGVCNGCQLGALLGWIPFSQLPSTQQPRFIHNVSSRYESRFSLVTILPSPSIFLKGMEGSKLGVWVSHGEGRAYFPDSQILDQVLEKDLAPIRYVDDQHQITQQYPHNPNGSSNGIAALCSPDGRHLFMMPHPERTHLTWQWPYLPPHLKDTLQASPWIRMFQNARKFCDENP